MTILGVQITEMAPDVAVAPNQGSQQVRMATADCNTTSRDEAIEQGLLAWDEKYGPDQRPALGRFTVELIELNR